MTTVTGLFKDQESAERAYLSATEAGYGANDISVIMSEETRERYYGKNATLETEVGSKAAEGAAIGGALGATAGAIAAAIAAVGTAIVVPGLGLVIAGPLAAGIAGAGAGGVTAGLVGALIGWGIPEDTLKQYETDVKEGGILIGVNSKNDEDTRRFQSDWGNPELNRV
ncbi:MULTISPECIES: hypothetical protein [unclassified Methylophilus]|uniref:hypothetical protein n=1 Tax=unclassified Methylophilus TaxID=2630143 RepID=UPI0006FC5465|nr:MULTISPECIES: hypothetical protein [unclassified Methylophilus]KQT43823.1 hypothetical protein ASG34_03360 [Methylophilus sp. Leaf416]KQT59307.1 hypothetical protein ASG44_03365 [Methylophilus sp. Leaf459]